MLLEEYLAGTGGPGDGRTEPGMRPDAGGLARGARILVVGCGGGGTNMVDVIDAMGLGGAETAAVNTDRTHLNGVSASRKVLVGKRLSTGMGTGGDLETGRSAVESSTVSLEPLFEDRDLVLILTSLGGGTGTGGAPALCRLAREAGATAAVIATLPFRMETTRRRKAFEALPALREAADNVILFDQNHLVDAAPQMPVDDALGFMNFLVGEVVRGLVESTTMPSRINIDFADLRSVLSRPGLSMVLIGEVNSTDPMEVVNATLENPFADIDHSSATAALVHITGGDDLTLRDAQAIADTLTLDLHYRANVVLGARLDSGMDGRVKVIALFTGISAQLDADGAGDEVAEDGPGCAAPGPADRGGDDIFSRYGVTVVERVDRDEPATLRARAVPRKVGERSYYSLMELVDSGGDLVSGNNGKRKLGVARTDPDEDWELPAARGTEGGGKDGAGPAGKKPMTGFIRDENAGALESMGVDIVGGDGGRGGRGGPADVLDDIMIS